MHRMSGATRGDTLSCVFGPTPIPRYSQLAHSCGDASQRLPGSLLPSIEPLMAEFDATRFTLAGMFT